MWICSSKIPSRVAISCVIVNNLNKNQAGLCLSVTATRRPLRGTS